MPFTFSHAAAAVPLARPLRLPLSALVVGSLSPDLLYFLELEATGLFGHSFAGLFAFCLPTGLVVLWLWHRVIKRPAAALLPTWVRLRVAGAAAAPFAFGPGRRLLLVSAGIVVGAMTHDFWDAFTHAPSHVSGWMVERLPVLQRAVPFPFFGSMPLFKLAQIGSSAVGGALLAWWAWRWLRAQVPQPGLVAPLPAGQQLGWALGLPLGALLLAGAYARSNAAPLTSYLAFREFVLQLIFTSGTALWLGLLGFAGWYRRQTHQAEPGGLA